MQSDNFERMLDSFILERMIRKHLREADEDPRIKKHMRRALTVLFAMPLGEELTIDFISRKAGLTSRVGTNTLKVMEESKYVTRTVTARYNTRFATKYKLNLNNGFVKRIVEEFEEEHGKLERKQETNYGTKDKGEN